jgi:CPA2 family monovalent cation:H+ antiporter-2
VNNGHAKAHRIGAQCFIKGLDKQSEKRLPMPHDIALINTLAIGLSTAFVFGWLASRLHLPPLLGYLLAGIAVGPFTPGFVADVSLAPQLAEIGVILLMFGVGMHFSIADLMAVKRIAVPGALLQMTVATALGWALATWWGWSHAAALVFGLSLSVASTVVLLRALEDQGGLHTEVGRIAVGWLIVEDLLMVLALVVLPTLAPSATASGAQAGPADVWLALGITFAKVAAFVVFMLVVGLRFFPWLLKQVERTGSRELFTLAVVAVALGVALGSAALFGVSFALGAFFAGIVIHESDLSERAATESQPLQDLFGALFFVSVGMLLDPMVLVEKPVQVLMVTLIIVLGKSLASFVIVRALGYPLGSALTVSAALAQIGEFSFILAGLGISLRLLPDEANDLILAGALLSITLNPLMFKLVTRWAPKAQATHAARA